METERRDAWWAARPWSTAALLYLPMAAVVLAHLLLPPAGRWPSGFLQYDQQSYMAMARESLEGGAWPLFGLPTSADPDRPQLYLYPHLALLGLLQAAADLDPGRLYLGFGALAGLVFLRLAIALYCRLVPERDGAAGLGLLAFCWGGGLFVLAGLTAGLSEGSLHWSTLFRFDPGGGFWFLNLGRNLFYGVEAYYHALALGLLLALIDRRWRLALALLALLAASHPFTGLQFLLIVLAWSGGETLLRRPAAPPPRFLAATALLLALFLAYHFWLLPTSDEHRALMAAWALDWSLPPAALLLAYGWLLPPALLRLRGRPPPAASRLLLAVLLVSLALAQHDLLIAPRQPLHFTRGYIWMPLFLLAVPQLVAFLRRLLARARPLALALLALCLLDNAAWLGLQALQNAGGFGAARTLAAVERAALTALAGPDYAGHLLIAATPRLGYDAIVYTPLLSWYAQEHSTPDSAQRLADLVAWRDGGAEPADWRRRAVVFLLPERDLAGLPWATPDSRVERVSADGETLLLVRRPPQE